MKKHKLFGLLVLSATLGLICIGCGKNSASDTDTVAPADASSSEAEASSTSESSEDTSADSEEDSSESSSENSQSSSEETITTNESTEDDTSEAFAEEKALAKSFAEAYFAGNIDEQKSYTTDPSSFEEYNEGAYPGYLIGKIVCKKNFASIAFTSDEDDSNSYLVLEFTDEDGTLKISSCGIDK